MHIKRIIDANMNRAAEGLRAVEEYFRFSVSDPRTAGSLRELRHSMRTILPEEMKDSPVSRDSVNDPGADLDESAQTRQCSRDVALANCKRAQEALRVLEEYLKPSFAEHAALFKKKRFDLYSIEKRLYSPFNRLSRSRLYIIVTESFCTLSFEDTVRAVFDGGADMVQLREKDMTGREFLERAEAAKRIAEEYDRLLVINDRPDIACICGADGVHVGRDDIPVDKVRRVFPSGFVGMSTHSPGQVTEAEKMGADYIGIGPVYSTATKKTAGRDPIGLDAAAEMAEQAGIPVFAIGGITRELCLEIKERGIPGVCICSAVISSDNPGKETAYFADIMKE